MPRPDVTIAFCAGRVQLVPVVRMLARRLRACDHFDRCRLRLAIVWDAGLQDLAPPQGQLCPADTSGFTEVRWLRPEAWRRALPQLAGGDPASTAILLDRPGYAARRNLAVLDAVRAGSRYLLFLDDDEYFAVPSRAAGGRIEWREVDPLGPHLEGLARGAAVTNGTALGQRSPVPAELARSVSPGLLRRLGRTLSAGSEVIGPSTFLRGARVHLAPAATRASFHAVERARGVPLLSGGNLALDLDEVRAGRIPPFCAPPGARGEDALFGLRALRLPLLRVPAPLFHDPFARHTDVPDGARPQQLEPAPATPAAVARFGRAFLGWIRYAPLLLRLRAAGDETAYTEGIERMRDGLAPAAPVLARCLWPGFLRAPETLARFHHRSAADLAAMRRVDAAWPALVERLREGSTASARSGHAAWLRDPALRCGPEQVSCRSSTA